MLSQKITFFVLVALCTFSLSQDTDLATVKATFDIAEIPEDTELTFDPTTLLEVSFPQLSSNAVDVTAGVQLVRNQTAIPPIFAIQDATTEQSTGTFVVAMVDLDAPTPQQPTNAQIRHFLGGNFALGSSDTDGLSILSNSTPAVSEYKQPTPPAGSDPHRYVFLLFNQPDGFNDQTLVNSTTSISNFNISQFAADVGLGEPIGGTFILVGPDASV